MLDVLETRTIDQLAEAVAVPTDSYSVVQQPGGPAQKIRTELLFQRFLGVAVATETKAELEANLAYPDSSLALVYADPTPGVSGYYLKRGAVGAGDWVLTNLTRGDKGDPGGNVMAIGLFSDAGTTTVPAGCDLVHTSGWRTRGKGVAKYARWAVPMAALDALGQNVWWFQDQAGARFFLAETTITPHMFGAEGNGLFDDTDGIRAAYSFGRTVGNCTVAWPRGNYRTSQEIDTDSVMTTGAGTKFVEIKATAAIRSLVKITGQNNYFSGVTLHGGDIASYCVYFENSNGSVVDNIIAQFAALDIVHWPAFGNNNNTKVQNSLLRLCGKTWYSTPEVPTRGRIFQAISGTATTTAGSATITFAGAPALTTLGLRPFLDYVYLTGDDRARLIYSVTANTIVTSPALPFKSPLAGVTFKLLSGNVCSISPHGDNSAPKIRDCTLQVAPGSAIRSAALYGVQSQGNQMEVLGYGIHSGIADNSAATIGMRALDDYFEIFEFKAIYLEQSTDAVVRPAQLASWSDILITDYAKNSGLEISYAGVRLTDGVVLYVNVGAATVDTARQHHFSSSSGAAHPVVTLPDMKVAAKATPSQYGITLRLVFLGIGGRVVTLKTSDGTLIDGVAGATGVPFIGDQRTLILSYDPTFGWVVAASGADMAAATPTAGTWARGRRFFYTSPSPAGKAGEICTTAGVAGSTAVFKPFGAIDA